MKYQEEQEYIQYREELLRDLLSTVRDLNDENFRVKLKQRYVEIYKNKDS